MAEVVVTAHAYLTITVEADDWDEAVDEAEKMFQSVPFNNDVDPGSLIIDHVTGLPPEEEEEEDVDVESEG